MTGVYVLIVELESPGMIGVGRWPCIHFRSGFYVYVGSALSGIEPRLARHLGNKQKCHWHIDYLLDRATIRKVVYALTGERKECSLARELALRLPSVPGFGSSDCRCPSHLFFSPDFATLQKDVIAAFREAGLRPVVEKLAV